jgi:RHS repeat-associated protein
LFARVLCRTQGSEVRTFLFGSGNQVLEETLNGQRLALYGWGADGLASRTDANGQTLFYLKDALGSVMAIVDGRGAVVQSYEYSAYGESLSGKDAVNAFRFVGGAGGYTDDASGLVQFWNRWYDPQVGKWVSEDPIRQAGGDANLSRYVKNRTTVKIDPDGLMGVFPRPTTTPFPILTNPTSCDVPDPSSGLDVPSSVPFGSPWAAFLNALSAMWNVFGRGDGTPVVRVYPPADDDPYPVTTPIAPEKPNIAPAPVVLSP